MGVILQSPSLNPTGTPIIGFDNRVKIGNVFATSDVPGHSVTNLANPSTYLHWENSPDSPAAPVNIFLILNTSDPIDYVAIAKHNLKGSTIQMFGSTTNSPSDFIALSPSFVVPDARPIIMQFAPQTVGTIQIFMLPVATLPVSVAVVYAGKLLNLGRGVKVEVEHVPIVRARKATVVNGMSESGNFLGRIVLSEMHQTRAEFFGFQDSFYIQNIEAFAAAAQEIPFFFAWAPAEYPLDTAYAWTINDIQPGLRVDTNIRAVSMTIEMRSIAP